MKLSWKWLAPLSLALVLLASLHGRARSASATPTEKSERPLTSLPYTPSLDIPSMDKSVDPCVDFYAYSCGGWMKHNPIPPDQAVWSVYGKLADENMRFLWGALEQSAQPRPGRSAVEQKIGDYFAACMDEPAIEKLGVKPIQPALDAVAALESKDELAGFLGRQHQTAPGGSLLFDWGSDQDFGNSESVIAFAWAGGLGLPDRDYYFKKDAKSAEIRKRYVEYVAQMLGLLGEPAAAAKTNAQRILAFETGLAGASLTRVERRDPYQLYHKMDRAQLQALTPSFRWDAYLSAMAMPTLTTLNVTQPRFFKQVDLALKTADLDTWKEYLRWHLVNSEAPYLSSKLVDANFNFYSKFLRGVTQQRPRWKRCVRWVDRDLGEALGQVFVQKTLGPEVKKRALAMTLEVEHAMDEDLKTLPWMGPQTKKQAFDKLHSIANKIAYPDHWRDYSSVDIRRDDFAGDVDRAVRFETRRQLNKIGRPLDRSEWNMTPPTVNAEYNPQLNDINFPAGVLQPPLFDFKMDDAPNYGNTGATIGHELTHGFDDEGRKFDAHGNLRDWWTKKDAAEFEKRTQCIVEQYGQYVVIDDIKINSKLSLGEDVADLGGTLLAYNAWRRATATERLHAIDGFSPDQRFFVGMAQWACENQRDEDKRLRAVTDPHSPGKYRINGVVANMPEFARAFSCKAGQPMVRATPCRVW